MYNRKIILILLLLILIIMSGCHWFRKPYSEECFSFRENIKTYTRLTSPYTIDALKAIKLAKLEFAKIDLDTSQCTINVFEDTIGYWVEYISIIPPIINNPDSSVTIYISEGVVIKFSKVDYSVLANCIGF